MSEDVNKIVEESKEWKPNDIGWTLVLLTMLFGIGGWENSENRKFDELEKKVARLEGQMSMIGGRKYE